MAKSRKSTARPTPKPKPVHPAPAFRPTYEHPRNSKPSPPSQAALAAQQGLLQLTFGRHAHGYGIVGAVACVVDALLLLAMSTNPNFPLLPGGIPDFTLWLIPAAAGAFASVDAVRLKREPYSRQYLSRHFITSVLGMVLFFIVAAFIFLITWGFLGEGFVRWIYPLAVLGVPLSIVSMAMTWEGLGGRKAGSILLSLTLPIFMFLLVIGNFAIAPASGTTPTVADILPPVVVFLAGAVTTEIAGSLLHIIASSTSVYQREILKADNTKVALLQQELQKKREALDYRERSIRGREAHTEALQQELDEQAAELKTKLGDVTQREVSVEKGTKDLRELDRKVASARAEIEAKVEELRLREADVAASKQEAEKLKAEVTAREAALGSREQEIKRKDIELTSQSRTLEQKHKAAEDREARLGEAEKSLDSKRTALLKQSKDLELKESELKLKGEQLEATHGATETARIRELKDWESKILAKDREIKSKEVELGTLENQLRERYENATRIEKQFQKERKIAEDRERDLVTREKSISDKESDLRERSSEVERMAASIQDAQSELQGKTKKYAELFKEAKLKEAAAGSSQDEIRQKGEALEARERKLTGMQTNLQAEIKRLNEENRKLLEKGKEIEERESEVSLKEMELENRAKEERAAAATPGMRDMDREAQLEEWERRLREREEEFKRRMYQKDKEMEMRETALKAHLTTPTAEAEEAVSVEKKAEKVKTGTPRLDDLLYGGIPFNSNLLVVGPAFVGKEVAILNFVAEGLKKSIPAIIVTTTKLPIDIAKDMAPILPTFVEYDQLGLVRWIDCTAPTATGKTVKEKNVWRVNGPTDFDAVFSIISQLDEEFKAKYSYFRLAFMTLSSSITQADERDALNFFQKLVNRLRQTKVVSLFALERGMHTDQTIEALEHTVDGALHFRQDKQKTQMQVAGLSEVQTRDWIPYKFTNKAIMIGSFQLERIR